MPIGRSISLERSYIEGSLQCLTGEREGQSPPSTPFKLESSYRSYSVFSKSPVWTPILMLKQLHPGTFSIKF